MTSEKRLLWMITFFILTSCGLPRADEISKSVHNTGRYISENSWDKAADEIKLVEDYFYLSRFDYEKSKRESFEEQIHQTELSIASADQTKSKENWKKLNHLWIKIKDREKQ
ncbi:hypothetical protein ACFQ5F_12925 [Kroppenstedtia eburnea]|uniref:hypothetical protein n=1 Tax=Kroppenstedtia eburnea TaxID=714067 RepID=UPI00058CC8B5